MNHNLRRDARFDRFFLDWLFGWITLAVAIGSSCRLQAADEGLPRSENSSFMTVTEPDITDETISRSYALDWWRLRPKRIYGHKTRLEVA